MTAGWLVVEVVDRNAFRFRRTGPWPFPQARSSRVGGGRGCAPLPLHCRAPEDALVAACPLLLHLAQAEDGHLFGADRGLAAGGYSRIQLALLWIVNSRRPAVVSQFEKYAPRSP